MYKVNLYRLQLFCIDANSYIIIWWIWQLLGKGRNLKEMSCNFTLKKLFCMVILKEDIVRLY